MKKKLLTILKLAAVGSTCWLGVICYDSYTEGRGMPPGYYLECDDAGRYRACRNGRALFDLSDPSSKAAAIRRAWRQYEYEVGLSGGNWKRCE